MRIVQTEDGRYIKVLDPQMVGLIGRVYKEIDDRRAADENQESILETHGNQLTIIDSQMEMMLIRYAEIVDILRKLYPEDEPIAHLDRPLLVDGSVKAHTFIASEPEAPPLTVTSQALVHNLNVEFLGGDSLADIHTTIDEKVQELDDEVASHFAQERTISDESYAPMSHVNEGGPGVHPYASVELAGFMSPVDKLDHDRMKAELDTIDLPGGMSIGTTAPSFPRLKQVWIDIN